ILATAVTSICHGAATALQVENQALKVFEHNDHGELRSIAFSRKTLGQGIPISKLLHMWGLEESVSAGRRLIRGGGCKINGDVVLDEEKLLNCEHFDDNGGYVAVFCGKKRRLKVVLED
ncbi:MAG: tyrosine--tRNA ligase, partial [Anaplasma sp.]|nr:tyrosine--tRNA ligase [Anaplasma sp.]